MKKPIIDVSFENQTSSLIIREDLKESLVLYSIKHMISSAISGVSDSEIEFMKYFINEENFDCIWNNLPDSRTDLITTLIYISKYRYNLPLYLFSKEFSFKKLKEIEASLANIHTMDSNIERLRVLNAIDGNFDYLGEIDKFIKNNISQDIINLWIEASLERLNINEEYISKLFSKVKRSQGSSDLKSKILTFAIDRNIIPEKEIKSIAESSPINLKRQVVVALANCKRRSDYIVTGARTKKEEDDRENYVLSLNKKSEELMMKFSSTKDSNILNILADNISSKNLPWILPLVSSYPYIVKKVQSRINRGV